jgi:hypothetical protein
MIRHPFQYQEFLESQLRYPWVTKLIDSDRHCIPLGKSIVFRNQEYRPEERVTYPRIGRPADQFNAPSSMAKRWWIDRLVNVIPDNPDDRKTGAFDHFVVTPAGTDRPADGFTAWTPAEVDVYSSPEFAALDPQFFHC